MLAMLRYTEIAKGIHTSPFHGNQEMNELPRIPSTDARRSTSPLSWGRNEMDVHGDIMNQNPQLV
jgi:hypothetical protein